MEGPISFWGYKEQESNLILPEHDDDDDDDKKTNVLGEKNRRTEYSKGNKTVPGKVATTHTGYLNKHYNINQKDEDT